MGRAGAVLPLAERAFLWQREGEHPHTSIKQEFPLSNDDFTLPDSKNGEKKKIRGEIFEKLFF